ncbi:YbgA family protein, partial [Acidobacteriota bacterium]
RVLELEKDELCGFVFKAGSPSSGLMRVKVYKESGGPATKNGIGIFARAFVEHFPCVPVEEEGRLNDPALRENFIERLFTYYRWRTLLAMSKSRAGLVDFHTRNKLLILSHSPRHYREMGRLVADAKKLRPSRLFGLYEQLLMEALAQKATEKKNSNVLMHGLGYFKKQLSADEKQELLEIIGQYNEGLMPLIVPVTLLNHYVRKYQQPYLSQQYYLSPHPIELKLRNHA